MKAKSSSRSASGAPAPRAQAAEKPKRVRKDIRVEPFSKWQKLVVGRMAELGLSTRALAAKISTPSWKPENTTVWAWTRSKDGCPPKEGYDAAVNARLANALEIHPDVLAAAYEDARRHLVVASATPQRGPLSVLRTLFLESSRKSWKKQEIIDLIDQVQGY